MYDNMGYPFTLRAQLSRVSNDFTLSLWVCTAAAEAPSSIFSVHQTVEGPRGLYLTAGPGGMNIQLTVGGADRSLALASQNLQWHANQWYNIQLTCAGDTFALYRDGQKIGEGATSEPMMRAASWYSDFGAQYGLADEIRFYNRALTQEELSAVARLEE